jgi:hypothetical protein
MKIVLALTVGIALIALGSVSASSNSDRWNSAGKAPTQTITICKATKPLGGGTNFPFTWANGFGSLPSFSLNSGQCVTKDVTHQDHFNKFTENVPAGWKLSNIWCTYTTSVVNIIGANNNPGFQPGDNTVTIDLNEANVTCTFLNNPSQPCTPRPSGMVSWWTGDGVAIDRIGAINGTTFGAASYTPGMVAQSFNFNSPGYIEVPDNGLHLPKGSFTVDAWVKPHGFIAGGRMSVVSKDDCGGICPNTSLSTYQLIVESGNVKAIIRDTDAGGISGGQGQSLTGPFVADGNWHHLAMVREVATKQFLLYVDGVLVNSAALNAGADSLLQNEDQNPDPLYIGAKKKSGASFQAGGVANMEDFFIGMIDEVEYFNRALAASEIANIYNAGSNGKCKN